MHEERAADPLVGRWQLDRTEVAHAIDQRAVQASLTGTQNATERARQQKAMLALTDVDFAFRRDGTFHWTTRMRLPQGVQQAVTRGTWTQSGNGVEIRITEQDGSPMAQPPTKAGAFDGARLAFKDPLMDLILTRLEDPLEEP